MAAHAYHRWNDRAAHRTVSVLDGLPDALCHTSSVDGPHLSWRRGARLHWSVSHGDRHDVRMGIRLRTARAGDRLVHLGEHGAVRDPERAGAGPQGMDGKDVRGDVCVCDVPRAE